ncbi:hypothetical protein ACFP2T_21910 [Plantactinospora solaniradicis]|uniref:Uncharacterized protein n=1 Tax=Plantactinospora solaniradicis TaxID=1723736 RepID=A0ABW1KB87_9ACTN
MPPAFRFFVAAGSFLGAEVIACPYRSVGHPLADFITSGSYDRHIRRMRQRYRQRRNLLVDTLAEHAPHVTATGIAAGLHSVLRLPPGTERTTVNAAAWLGIALDGLATFRHPQATVPAEDALVVGYATPPDHAYRAALDALRRALPPRP